MTPANPDALADALARVTAERDEAREERDALKQAAGFKPGAFRDDLSRDVILNDIAGMRPAMVEARRAAARVQVDADLWTMRMLEEWPGDTLLVRLWRQRQEATKAKATAEARAAQLQAEVEALKGKLTEAAEAADAPWSGYSTYQTSIDSEEAHNLRRCREIVRTARTALAARAATAREGQADG